MNEERNIPQAAVPSVPSRQGGLEEERTPAIIGAEIRTLSVQCNTMRVQYAIEIGRRLCEAKDMCKHGEWLDFLKRETAYSQPRASRLMQIYREYAADQIGIEGAEAKYSTLNNLSISNALRLLELPEEERESFAKAHDVEHLSTREVEALVKERTAELEAEKQKLSDAVEVLTHDRDDLKGDLDRAEEKLELSDAEKAKMEEQLLRIQQEIREIEARPQAVAVERDEQAIQEAVQAERERLEHEREALISKAANDAADAERAKHATAEKDYKAKIAELNRQIKEAEAAKTETTKQIQELTEKAKAAEKAGAESKQLRAQIKDLQGQLTLASPEVAQFKAAFDRAQAELVTMLKALHKVEDAEVKAKLSTAARTVLANFAGQVEG